MTGSPAQRAKIDGLNEEYAKIGLEVFKAFIDDFFRGVEGMVEARHDKDGGNGTDTNSME